MTYLESALNDLIKIENYISGLQQTMLSKNFYQQSAEEISGFKQNLSDQEAALAELYVRWEVLESKEA
jgi:hypothetical protein